MFRSTKTYGHEVGLSACFRQHKAESHCRFLHGYALAFTFVFEAEQLDHRNWVIDFGGLDLLKQRLKKNFDHTLLVAYDDPELPQLQELDASGLADVNVLNSVGCEAFAELGFHIANALMHELGHAKRVKVVSCEVREHGANSAIYIGARS